ncbi:DUF7835 family putative zinc beta-ribbon protein [Halegenticoccus tardaugens]
MSKSTDALSTIQERCLYCDRETSHKISIIIITESKSEENSEFSREPYRVSRCMQCGRETKERMNNA